MTKVRARGEDIRRYILGRVDNHPNDIGKITAKHFGITRQAVNKHLQKLCAEYALTKRGKTQSISYKLASLTEWRKCYPINPDLAEDIIWTNFVRDVLSPLPDNILDIWHYGFTEMFNNAIDHSGGSEILVNVRKNAISTEMLLADNGIGIFKKIQTEMHLLDERHAILELSKGKLTTDPKNHTGEGIFFTSRMFDSFDILSGGVFFTHQFGDESDLILEGDKFAHGTSVWMRIHNHTARTVKKIFDQFTSGDDFGFNKTIVPVKLAQYGNDKLISRSQAKRVLTRIELFKTVIFDFAEVEFIGQAFADEIFRVFAQKHPEIQLLTMKTNSKVRRMIERAKASNVSGSINIISI
jgi:anti-sigma regulatory factor (Ser/Thr protein kinase)